MNPISFFKPIVEKFPMAASLYRWVRDEKQFRHSSTKTPWGFTLAGNELMATGNFEPEETAIVRKLLAEVDVLINIGANIGYYCCHALSMDKEVIAFEPLQDNLRYFNRNIYENNWSCEIYPVAVSDKPGILKLYGASTGASLVAGWANSSEEQYLLVPCSTVDTIIGKRFAAKRVLVVLDIEGAEFWALRGAQELINNAIKPVWLIEISSTQQQPKGVTLNPKLVDTFQLMFDAGYNAITADKKMLPVTAEDIAKVQAGKPSVFDSTHNFLFRH